MQRIAHPRLLNAKTARSCLNATSHVPSDAHPALADRTGQVQENLRRDPEMQLKDEQNAHMTPG
jgi:hypothetical protein